MPVSERKTILLVEDHATTQALFANRLRLEGFMVLTACCADEALQICKQYPDPLDLLVADVLLPRTREFQILRNAKARPSHISGVDLARQVRFKRPEARVLFISGHSDQELQRLGVFKEPWPFLRKPFHAATLVETVEQVLSTKYPPWVQ